MKKALITGITGQDGSYLAEFLLKKRYQVHGIIRRTSTHDSRSRLEPIYEDPHTRKAHLFLHYGDLNDASSLNKLIRTIRPDEIYNLGAQSHVKTSFEIPEYTSEITGVGTVRLLEAIRESGLNPKYYQASSSEMFGRTTGKKQNEQTPFHPVSPYAASKEFAFRITVIYRESYGIFACNGILFNHESPRRGETFVTRKITMAVARIVKGSQDKLYLGNLDAKRDWGFAGDYVEVMWRMLQYKKADDYVIATGETHSVREFLDEAFGYVGLNWKKYVAIDPRYFRPLEVEYLCGDASKARRVLGWKPKVSFKQLVRLMVDADINLAKERS